MLSLATLTPGDDAPGPLSPAPGGRRRLKLDKAGRPAVPCAAASTAVVPGLRASDLESSVADALLDADPDEPGAGANASAYADDDVSIDIPVDLDRLFRKCAEQQQMLREAEGGGGTGGRGLGGDAAWHLSTLAEAGKQGMTKLWAVLGTGGKAALGATGAVFPSTGSRGSADSRDDAHGRAEENKGGGRPGELVLKEAATATATAAATNEYKAMHFRSKSVAEGRTGYISLSGSDTSPEGKCSSSSSSSSGAKSTTTNRNTNTDNTDNNADSHTKSHNSTKAAGLWNRQSLSFHQDHQRSKSVTAAPLDFRVGLDPTVEIALPSHSGRRISMTVKGRKSSSSRVESTQGMVLGSLFSASSIAAPAGAGGAAAAAALDESVLSVLRFEPNAAAARMRVETAKGVSLLLDASTGQILVASEAANREAGGAAPSAREDREGGMSREGQTQQQQQLLVGRSV
ncbi:unnamed protein product, partial [Closterium sp. NIES-54]